MFKVIPILKYIILWQVIFSIGQVHCFASDNVAADLRKKLLDVYHDPLVRPVIDIKTNTTVSTSLVLLNLDVDLDNQLMAIETYIMLTWKDEYLTWTAADYENIKSVRFSKSEIWVPDMTLYNSADTTKTKIDSDMLLLAFSDGSVIWVPSYTAQVHCQIDSGIDYEQTCSFNFGSWTYENKDIDVQLTSKDSIKVDNVAKNKHWRLTNAIAEKKQTIYGDFTDYYHLQFNLTVQRIPEFNHNYHRSAFTVMVLVLASYMLPMSHHSTKIILHLFAVAILGVCNFNALANLSSTGKDFTGIAILTLTSLVSCILMTTWQELKIDFRSKFTSLIKSTKSDEKSNDNKLKYSSLKTDTETPQITPFNLLNIVIFLLITISFIINYLFTYIF